MSTPDSIHFTESESSDAFAIAFYRASLKKAVLFLRTRTTYDGLINRTQKHVDAPVVLFVYAERKSFGLYPPYEHLVLVFIAAKLLRFNRVKF